MALTLTIDGIDRAALLRAETLRIAKQLNGRNTCALTLRDPAGTLHPAIGVTVAVTDGATTHIKGTLDRVREAIHPGTGLLDLALECVDFSQLADRHLVAEIYENLTMKQIVEDIRIEHLAADGVTLDPAFPDGPTFERIPFDHIPAAQAFDELSEMTGFLWDIDDDKVLRFLDRSTLAAPAALDEAAPIWLIADGGSLVVERTRERYRNEQIIRGGVTVTDFSLTKTFKGDGETQSFPLDLDVDSIVSIKVNAVAKTVGVRGVDTGKDWYYQVGDKIISQESDGTKLISTDTLEVIYFGQFPLRILARDVTKVTERAAVEGGSGLYTAIEDFEDIDRLPLGRDRAEGLLRRFGRIDDRVTFTTRTSVGGWRPGQMLPVSVPSHALTGTFMVSEVELADHRGIELRAQVTAVSGEAVESWVAFFKKLAQGGRRKAIRANEPLHLIRAFTEPVEVTETFAATTEADRAYQWDRSPTPDQWGRAQWR